MTQDIAPELRKSLTRFANDDAGATSLEYALIAVILSISIISSLTSLRTQITGLLGQSTTALQNSLAE